MSPPFLAAHVEAGPQHLSLPLTPTDDALWPGLATQVQHWAKGCGVVLRDVVWLLPFSALLPLARRALAAQGGWQPRVETLDTLAGQLAPVHRVATPTGYGDDAATNRLQAAALLRQQDWGLAWARHDAQAFGHGVAALVETAQALHRAAAARAPAERPAWWADARARLALASGPGGTERALARIALEWVAESEAGAGFTTDRLFDLPASAWVALTVGGLDPLAAALLAHATGRGVPALLLHLDPAEDGVFAAAAALRAPRQALCADAEAEAQAAAAQVLYELQAATDQARSGAVALVAQDRETVRRVRALLERLQVPLVDDTGWRLTTTRAAARAMALLRAAKSLRGAPASDGAAADVRLAWLKDDPLGKASPEALTALEALWRKQRQNEHAVQAALTLWQQAQARLAPLVEDRVLSLRDWLSRLATLWLTDPAHAASWRNDAAGRAVLAALRLEVSGAEPVAWQEAALATRFTLDELITWVDEALEEASFVPDNPPEARVVITPMARVMLRPFAAVVCPGTDERRLGAAEPRPDLLGPAVAQALGVDGPSERLRREALAFVQMLRLPRVTLLRRLADGAESLGASPLTERLLLARLAAGIVPAALPVVTPALPRIALPAQPLAPPLPQVGGGSAARWPASLSASAVEALRDCPYRFFARVPLGLSDVDELGLAPGKRDYGVWLHAVLMRFHDGREATLDAEADAQRLRACAAAIDVEQDTTDGDLLPFQASFEALAPSYLRWLHAREAQGWRWWQGELSRELHPPELAGMGLHGRLDRLDRAPNGDVQLLDYKTGNAVSLKDKVAQPMDDTQLAFYAALVLGDGLVPAAGLTAAYLAIDDRDAPLAFEHLDVAGSATALLHHLGGELQRLRAGEPLQALGQGRLCDHCEMRGLCRRDHWAAPPDPASGTAADSETSDPVVAPEDPSP